MPFNPHSKPLMTPIKRRMINVNKPGWEAFWTIGSNKVVLIYILLLQVAA